MRSRGKWRRRKDKETNALDWKKAWKLPTWRCGGCCPSTEFPFLDCKLLVWITADRFAIQAEIIDVFKARDPVVLAFADLFSHHSFNFLVTVALMSYILVETPFIRIFSPLTWKLEWFSSSCTISFSVQLNLASLTLIDCLFHYNGFLAKRASTSIYFIGTKKCANDIFARRSTSLRQNLKLTLTP